MIATAEANGACKDALAWLREAPRTIDELVHEQADYTAWAMSVPGFADLLTDDELDDLARVRPGAALAWAHARLSDATFSYCVRERPWMAQEYARDRLSAAQITECRDR